MPPCTTLWCKPIHLLFNGSTWWLGRRWCCEQVDGVSIKSQDIQNADLPQIFSKLNYLTWWYQNQSCLGYLGMKNLNAHVHPPGVQIRVSQPHGCDPNRLYFANFIFEFKIKIKSLQIMSPDLVRNSCWDSHHFHILSISQS